MPRKSKQIHLLVPVLIMILFVLGYPVSASVPPENTPEIQNLVTTTGVNAVGTVTQNDNLAWRLSSEELDANLNYGVNQAIFDPGSGYWNPIPDPDNPDVYIGWDYDPTGTGLFNSAPYPDQPPGYEYWTTTAEPPLNPLGEVQMAS